MKTYSWHRFQGICMSSSLYSLNLCSLFADWGVHHFCQAFIRGICSKNTWKSSDMWRKFSGIFAVKDSPASWQQPCNSRGASLMQLSKPSPLRWTWNLGSLERLPGPPKLLKPPSEADQTCRASYLQQLIRNVRPHFELSTQLNLPYDFGPVLNSECRTNGYFQ